MKHYESDITKFLKQLKAENPNIEAEQLHGRSLLWDQQPRSLEDQHREQLARVKKSSYEYYK